MKKILIFLIIETAILFQSHPVRAQGTAFTYQGQLKNASNPANGNYDFSFAIFTNNTGGNSVAGPIAIPAASVSNGLFSVTLDFGGAVFNGASNWLEISVRTNSGGGYTVLSPRQILSAAPYAITAGSVTGVVSQSQLPAIISSGAEAANSATVFPNTGTIVKRDASGSIVSNSFCNMLLYPTNTYFSSDVTKCPGGVTYTLAASMNSFLFTASQPVITRANGWVSGLQFSPQSDDAQYWVFEILNKSQFLAMDISCAPAHKTYTTEVAEISPVALFVSDNTGDNEGVTIQGDGSVGLIGNGGNSAALMFANGPNTWRVTSDPGRLAFTHLAGAGAGEAFGIYTNFPNGGMFLGGANANVNIRVPVGNDQGTLPFASPVSGTKETFTTSSTLNDVTAMTLVLTNAPTLVVTNAPPVNMITPKVWFTFTNSGQVFLVPGYQ